MECSWKLQPTLGDDVLEGAAAGDHGQHVLQRGQREWEAWKGELVAVPGGHRVEQAGAEARPLANNFPTQVCPPHQHTWMCGTMTSSR